MKSTFVFTLYLMLLYSGNSFAQDPLDQPPVFPGGISVEYGLGRYSVRDEYISKEKYSGTLPHIEASWARFHNRYGYHLGLTYRSSSNIKNYNVSADIHQFSLNQGFLYPLPSISLFTRDVYVLFGPSTELYFYYNKQNIAVSGFDYAQSFASLLSLGAHARFTVPIAQRVRIESSIYSSVLSIGLRIVDTEEEEESPAKLLTLLSGTNTFVRLGIRYHLFGDLSLKFAYRFHMTRISAWNPLLSSSDDTIASLTYGF